MCIQIYLDMLNSIHIVVLHFKFSTMYVAEIASVMEC